jgi:glycosyltransferase involved in cell wall biosynthesis
MLQVSLVIPVRDEAATLPLLLNGIASQTRKPQEVIFVDGGSMDETVAIVRAACESDGRFRVIEAGDATPGDGRNIGILAARHDWIALTDAGIRLEPTWLERLADVIDKDNSIDVVYGNYEPQIDSFFGRSAALCYVAPKQSRPAGLMRGPSVASALIRRDVWRAVGEFPALRAAEDLIFMERIQEQGCRIGWAPTATVWWQLRPTLRSTFQKFVLYSMHNVWAGRQWDWHYGVAKKYLASVPFVALGIVHSFWWLIVPALIFLARVAKNIWVRREDRGLFWLLNPAQFLVVAAVLATIDLATFVGWVRALTKPDEQRRPARVVGIPGALDD